MTEPTAPPPDTRPDPDIERAGLTTRGHATVFAYRADVAALQEPQREAARADWAWRHRLRRGDEAYLSALSRCPLSPEQLEERLAVDGLTSMAVSATLARLVDRGFAEATAAGVPGEVHARVGPSVGAMGRELIAAEADLVAESGGLPKRGTQPRQVPFSLVRHAFAPRGVAARAMLEAIHRVDVARRTLVALRLEPKSSIARRRAQVSQRATLARAHRRALSRWADDGGDIR